MKKCKWEKESVSPSIPSIICTRCEHPALRGIFNCIGYENCGDYSEEEEKKDES